MEHENDKNVDNAILNILKNIDKLKEEKVSKPVSKHANYLNSVIEEFANPFILIGYDINGGYFQLINCNSQKEYDGLCVALDRCKEIGFGTNIDIEDYQ